MSDPAPCDRLAEILYKAGRLRVLPLSVRLEIAAAILVSEEWSAREAVLSAYERCTENRGAFACAEEHDLRCPKSRAASPEKWRDVWRCECGREELDTALSRLAAVRGRA